MKSKRRHELQTNELADWMGKKIEKVKPFSNLIVLGALAVVIVVVAVIFFINRGKQREAQEWRGYTIEANKRERDPAALTKVASSDPGSPAHLWALQAAADTQRDKGIDLLYEERSEGLNELETATKLYEEILRLAKDDFLQRRARYGLAKTLESKGDVDGAIKQYQELKNSAGEYAVGKDAKRQLARLERQKDFYKSFAEYKPSDSAETSQSSFLPERPDISFPGDYIPLPERPDISFPDGSGVSGGDFSPKDETTTNGDADDAATDSINNEKTETQKNPPSTPAVDDKIDESK